MDAEAQTGPGPAAAAAVHEAADAASRGATRGGNPLPGELLLDRGIHIAGLLGALVGSLLLFTHLNASHALGAGLYVAGLLAMLGCSTVHNWPWAMSGRKFLRRLDHAAIFLLIAGTYSPFTLMLAAEPAALSLFVFVWAAAAGGATLQLLRPSCLERVSIALYLALGWSGGLLAGPLVERLPPHLPWLIAIGGVLYSIGVIFHLWSRLPYQNAIWHGFVLAGAAVHYIAVAAVVID